jgi:hypothetical protein
MFSSNWIDSLLCGSSTMQELPPLHDKRQWVWQKRNSIDSIHHHSFQAVNKTQKRLQSSKHSIALDVSRVQSLSQVSVLSRAIMTRGPAMVLTTKSARLIGWLDLSPIKYCWCHMMSHSLSRTCDISMESALLCAKKCWGYPFRSQCRSFLEALSTALALLTLFSPLSLLSLSSLPSLFFSLPSSPLFFSFLLFRHKPQKIAPIPVWGD